MPTLNHRAYIAGAKFYPGAEDALAAMEPETDLRLVREPGNTYDPNAIEVYHGEIKLGHLPRDLAATVAPEMDAGTEVRCLRTQGRSLVVSYDKEDDDG